RSLGCATTELIPSSGGGVTRAVALLAGHIAAAVSHPSELEPQPAIVPLAAGLSAGAPGTDDCFGPAPGIPAVNTLRAGIRGGHSSSAASVASSAVSASASTAAAASTAASSAASSVSVGASSAAGAAAAVACSASFTVACFGEQGSRASSMTALGAVSPGRGPVLVIRR